METHIDGLNGHKIFIDTGSMLDKARNIQKRTPEENVDDYHLDVLRASNGTHVRFIN